MTSKTNPLFLKKETEAQRGEGSAPHCPVNWINSGPPLTRDPSRSSRAGQQEIASHRTGGHRTLEADLQMVAHLGAHRTLSARPSAVPLASCLLPVPIGATCSPWAPAWWSWVLAHSPGPAVQPSALGTAAPFSRKVTKSCCSLRGGGAAAGGWDQAASLSRLVLRLQAPGGRMPKSRLHYPGTWGLLDLDLPGPDPYLERSGSAAPHSPWTGDQVEGSGGHSAGARGDAPRCKPPFRALQGHSPQQG